MKAAWYVSLAWGVAFAAGLAIGADDDLARREGDRLNFVFFHPEFTDEGRIEHMKWLLMKREEYPGLKDKLKEIQDRYTWGEWLAPGVNC